MKLTIEHLNKKIKKRDILKDINMELYSGKIYGIVGRNGSGKTMLFRAISGLMKIDSGTVEWEGKLLHKDFEVLPNLGIVLENAGLYPDKSGVQNLRYLANVHNKIKDEQIKETIRRVGLDPEDKRSFRKYSLGMKQRIVLAQALMEQPDILLLDEPTNALDEDGVKDIREIIKEERERGALIILASHNATDIELLADEVFYMKDGSLSHRQKEEKWEKD